MWVKDVRLAHTRIIQLWGSLTVYATGVSESLTFTLQVWGSLTVMLWVWGSLSLELPLWGSQLHCECETRSYHYETRSYLPLWGSHSYTICMWGSLTFTLGVWAHSHVSWGLLTVMLHCECEAHSYLSNHLRFTHPECEAHSDLCYNSYCEGHSYTMGVRHVCECDTLELPLWGSVTITLQVWGSLTVTLGLCEYIGQSTLQNRVVISGKVFDYYICMTILNR